MRRVLIVSPDFWAPEVATHLGLQGLHASCASDVTTGQSVAEAITIDCFVYDIDLGLSGLEKLRRLQPHALFFAAVSQMTMDPEDIGADYLLLKPVDVQVVDRALFEHERWRSRSY